MKSMKIILILLLPFTSLGQSTQKTSAELYDDLQRFANTATVMYVAAHPDDENTRMISWLNHSKHVNTVYLSLTRGDGGQNLIGTEKGDLLGVLRSQELLEARKIDKGQQWFTRAVDFGYSKTATETLSIWDKDEILADVVWAIRLHRPDVIITRFDPDSNGRTHGHHTASAMLAVEAFDLAGDASVYPEQLEFVEVWQPKRLFFNTSWWFFGSRENFEKADKSDMISVDVGEYFPSLGVSNNEIASLSRSKHACQGFGSALQRGSQEEWLQLLKGDMPTNGDLLQGIESTWDRYQNGLGKDLDKIIKEFNFLEPEKTAADLLDFRKKNIDAREKIPAAKHETFRKMTLDLLGIYTEWTTDTAYGIEGETIESQLEITNRSGSAIQSGFDNETDGQIGNIASNEKVTKAYSHILDDANMNQYWLSQSKQGIGMYTVEVQMHVGLPEENNSPKLTVPLTYKGHDLSIALPLKYKSVNPAKGEKYEPFYTVPPVAVNFSDPVYLFAENKTQEVEVIVTSFVDNAEGMVQLDAGIQWMISQNKPFNIARKGEKQVLKFTVIPPKNQSINTLKASVNMDGETYFDSFVPVDYEHINKQFVFKTAEAKIGRIDMDIPDVNVGYVQGSGDVVPQSLRQVGVDVTELNEDQFSIEVFNQFDVIVVGIRAFNTLGQAERLASLTKQFAQQGGTVIVQYQTSRGLKVDDFAPYGLKLGRDRISQEDATLTLLSADHPVFNAPNKITQNDFEDWVQERGLYFASEWDSEFTPLLAGNDTGEDTKEGMLMVAPMGEGHYVYTGLSFFRELPAGVPGAYRLFMNLLALD